MQFEPLQPRFIINYLLFYNYLKNSAQYYERTRSQQDIGGKRKEDR